ncbi:MAG: lipopolysaccharide kinase InaA family protein [Tannerellaceae bacterium]|nr:lipopolysaccharide kinase InaA family protein [Tannerellaceae bacterium]
MIKTVIHPDYKSFTKFIESIPSIFETEGEVIFQGRNILKRFVVNDTRLIVKAFRKPNLLNRFVYISFRSSKACRSYGNGVKLVNAGFLTPMPVAYIENTGFGLNGSYYITTELEEAHEMREFWFIPEIGDRLPVLEKFGKYTAALHKKQIYHKDYSSGNILYKIVDGEPEFYLVDINRMRLDVPVTEEEGYRNFRSLWVQDEAYRVIACSYAQAMEYDTDKAVERICFYKDEFMKKRSS